MASSGSGKIGSLTSVTCVLDMVNISTMIIYRL